MGGNEVQVLIIGGVPTVYKLIEHLYHPSSSKVQDAHVLTLVMFKKVGVVAVGVPSQTYLQKHFEVRYLVA